MITSATTLNEADQVTSRQTAGKSPSSYIVVNSYQPLDNCDKTPHNLLGIPQSLGDQSRACPQLYRSRHVRDRRDENNSRGLDSSDRLRRYQMVVHLVTSIFVGFILVTEGEQERTKWRQGSTISSSDTTTSRTLAHQHRRTPG